MIAEVIINRTAKKLNRVFDYNVPTNLEELILVGSKVIIPFGKGSKPTQGFVVKLKERTNYDYKLKDIIEIEDNLSDKQINLAKWMAKRYFCNVSDCIKLMLAPGTRTENKERRIKEKKINAIYLKKDLEQIEFEIETNIIKSEKHKKVIRFVACNEGVTVPEIEMFTGITRAVVNTLIKHGYLEVVEKNIRRDPLINKIEEDIKEKEAVDKLELTEEQLSAYNKVENTIEKEKYKTFLLYGVTGSRKDRNIFTVN